MATRKKIDDNAESRINDAYAKAAERATGIKPMSEDPKFKNFGKTTRKKTTTKKKSK